MTYVTLIRNDHEAASNTAQDGPVRKTGLKALHDAAIRRLKGQA